MLPVSEPTTVDATWDAGGGADTGISTDANWDGDATPDLVSGETLAHFAAGTRATASGIVRFKGIEVIDLLRLASGKKLSIGEACMYLSMLDAVYSTIFQP